MDDNEIKIFDSVIHKINNINPNKIDDILNYVKINFKEKFGFVTLNKFIRKYLKISKPLTQYSYEYWILRGWSNDDVKIKRKFRNHPPGSSVYSKEYWIKKGFSDEESILKVKERRPTNKEYWIKKGFSDEESILKVNEHHKKGFLAIKNKYGENYYDYWINKSHRCKEYWIKKGFSEEDAIKQVSKDQSTFSLDKCIEKYGEEDGRKRWQERQDKWQNTLKLKSEDEIKKINKNKCVNYYTLIKKYGAEIGKEKFIKSCNKRNMLLFYNIDELINHVNTLFEESVFIRNMTVDAFIDKNIIKKYVYNYLNITDERNFLLNNFNFCKEHKIFEHKCKHGFGFLYQMYTTDNKLLKSGNEINFYTLLLENNIDNFEVNGIYPNSKKYYDFYLKDYNIYIELAGNINDEEYRQNMIYKQSTFNSIILISKKEQLQFIKDLKNGNVECYYKRCL